VIGPHQPASGPMQKSKKGEKAVRQARFMSWGLMRGQKVHQKRALNIHLESPSRLRAGIG
jgi:hypothetical protein